MTSQDILLIIFGLICGGALGWVSAWRFARKLELYQVPLCKWDTFIDMADPRPMLLDERLKLKLKLNARINAPARSESGPGVGKVSH